ncbi:hypothetical protein [Pseudoalteromonas luteoviolacea]|uniref:hypothetical protein n=1 Tax=Pseudoalteromonas luteoviolacea TaxID=43657 RepID=UPI0012DA3A94|nr:hypothetical protein [Pseudoalteromonas luteoviolacea]
MRSHGCEPSHDFAKDGEYMAVTFTSMAYLKIKRDNGALGESREGPASAPLWLSSPTRQNV